MAKTLTPGQRVQIQRIHNIAGDLWRQASGELGYLGLARPGTDQQLVRIMELTAILLAPKSK